ncbi:AMP-binding protein [Svornostia abyssi]|uniref:AMP-binding protein n=1 Tax=Svornostia abyssi TaxID=2898438 RepID=A0ABY5PJQ6_9ACTN|nr:AMP-binding protein [Parviterribacteraceae bacterium J379]
MSSSSLDELRLTGRQLAAVGRSGLLRPERPASLVRMAREIRRRGPFAGMAPATAIRWGDRPVFVDDDGPVTARELDERSTALARALQADGARAGQGAAILCRNHRGFYDAFFATQKLGMKTVLLNTGFAAPQIVDVCAREGVTTLLFDAEFAASAPAGTERHICMRSPDGSPGTADALAQDLIAAQSGSVALPIPEIPSTVVVLTSGTTGTPKGAPREAISPLASLGALLDRVPFRAGEAVYVAPPIFHGLGFATATLSFLLGTRVITSSRFDPREMLAAMSRYEVSGIVVVPAMLQRMLDLGPDEIARHPTPGLRFIFCSGAQLPGHVAERVQDTWGDVLHVLYGSTECAYATISVPEDHRAAPATVGRPCLGVTVKVLDDRRRELPVGETGTIFVRSGNEFGGYTDGTRKEMVGGLMSSGDVGHFDAAGRLFIDGRDDDMIVSGGENVFPQEVEELLVRHPAITDVSVLGVDDETFGKRLAAFVVIAEGASLTADEAKGFVRENLAVYKVPRDVIFLDELPRNPTGKILKRELRAQVQSV